MARTKTRSIPNMTGAPSDDVREWFRVTPDLLVLDAVARWDAYVAENAAWNVANGGTQQDAEDAWLVNNDGHTAPEHCAVADPGNITDAEKVFVEVRFFEADESDPDDREPLSAPWVQANSTHFPTLSAGFLADLLKIYNARRTFLGMDPTP